VRHETFAGTDNVSIGVTLSRSTLTVSYRPAGEIQDALSVFLALGTHRNLGAAVLPFAPRYEGSTVFLPFKSDLVLAAELRASQVRCFVRRWERWCWTDRSETSEFESSFKNGALTFIVPRAFLGDAGKIDCAIYAKNPDANEGWGWFWGCSDRTVDSGVGDKYISHYHELHLQSVTQSEVEEPG
jgi:hypothetical protein